MKILICVMILCLFNLYFSTALGDALNGAAKIGGEYIPQKNSQTTPTYNYNGQGCVLDPNNPSKCNKGGKKRILESDELCLKEVKTENTTPLEVKTQMLRCFEKSEYKEIEFEKDLKFLDDASTTTRKVVTITEEIVDGKVVSSSESELTK